MIKWLAFKYSSNFDWIVVVSPTAKFNGEYDWLPSKYHIYECDDKKLQWLLSVQARHPETRLLLIVDDGLGTVNFKTAVWLKLATTSRQYRISMFIATQFLHRIPNHLRMNSHYIVALKTTNDNEKKVLMNEYRIGLDKKQFEEMLEEATHDYGALLINNKSSSTDPKDVYTRIKAKPKEYEKCHMTY